MCDSRHWSAGVIGRRVVQQLVAAGHHDGLAVVEGLGVRAVEADVSDGDSLVPAFAAADAVVNLLTHIPGSMPIRGCP